MSFKKEIIFALIAGITCGSKSIFYDAPYLRAFPGQEFFDFLATDFLKLARQIFQSLK